MADSDDLDVGRQGCHRAAALRWRDHRPTQSRSMVRRCWSTASGSSACAAQTLLTGDHAIDMEMTVERLFGPDDAGRPGGRAAGRSGGRGDRAMVRTKAATASERASCGQSMARVDGRRSLTVR